MKPTEEQVKKLWEWCGLTEVNEFRETHHKDFSGTYHFWETPEGTLSNIPPIDLNNLFKYAVPKLGYIFVVDYAEGGWAWFIRGCDGAPNIAEGCHEDPALALFWAIWKIIEGDCNATTETK